MEDLLEDAPSTLSEPWEPEGLSFEVGDRVRIRLSGECRKEWRRSHGYPKVVGHPERLDGVSGRIDMIRSVDAATGDHRYGVMFDHSVACPSCPSPVWGGWFVVGELLPAAADDEAVGEGE